MKFEHKNDRGKRLKLKRHVQKIFHRSAASIEGEVCELAKCLKNAHPANSIRLLAHQFSYKTIKNPLILAHSVQSIKMGPLYIILNNSRIFVLYLNILTPPCAFTKHRPNGKSDFKDNFFLFLFTAQQRI